MKAPQTYQQWMKCLEYLGEKNVSDEYIELLKEGNCPGIDGVRIQFTERVINTVNRMLSRSTKRCTRLLNEALEEGDISNIETIFYRNYKEMKKSRFYLNLRFLPKEYVDELDRNTISEINRYWSVMQKNFMDLSEGAEKAELYDIVHYIGRVISREQKNHG